MDRYHTTVLFEETLAWLEIKPDRKYIDATLGGGGHGLEVANRGGVLLGIDQDQDALEYVKNRIKNQESRIKERLQLVKGNFKDLAEIARENGFVDVDGVLFDLGVSGHQFDTAERGFSFVREGPLDMRMDTDLSVKASDLVHGLTKKELEELFYKFGEERFGRKIADRIVVERGWGEIKTTGDLARIIEGAVPKGGHSHPATRVFQALRIAVNDELNNLRSSLPQALDVMHSGGRIVVISFQSLEDRIVKQQFRAFEDKGKGTVLTKKPVIPGEQEVAVNVRSRSAKLRVFEKGN